MQEKPISKPQLPHHTLSHTAKAN